MKIKATDQVFAIELNSGSVLKHPEQMWFARDKQGKLWTLSKHHIKRKPFGTGKGLTVTHSTY